MVRPLSLSQHTLYAELLEQGADDLFDPDWPENGSLLIRGNRAGAPAEHVYYQGYRLAAGDPGRGQRYARYLGRADDPEVAAQIARFRQVKAVRAERITTVRALIGAGMPRPDKMTGRVIEALARAGLFSGDAVLTGRAAYQTYDGILGVRSAKPRNAASRARPAVEIVVRDGRRSAEIFAASNTIDPSFAAEVTISGSCRSATGVQVAVTCLDRTDEETADQIGFLIADPVYATVLHGPGIPVAVPAPEHCVVHALIVHGQRDLTGQDQAKAGLAQAMEIVQALSVAGRRSMLVEALTQAWERRPGWRTPLRQGLSELPELMREPLLAHLDDASARSPKQGSQRRPGAHRRGGG